MAEAAGIDDRRFRDAESDYHEHLNRQLRFVTEVGGMVSDIVDLEDLLRFVVEELHLAFGYDYSTVFLADPTETDMLERARAEERGSWVGEDGERLAIGRKGIIGWVGKSGEHIIVNNVSKDPRYYPNPDYPHTRSEMAVPIMTGGEVLGVLDVQSKRADAFGEEDLLLLRPLAGQIAMAVKNSHLLAERDHRMAELAVFNRISYLIAAPKSLDDTLNAIIHSANALFQVEAAYLLLLKGDRLVCTVALGEMPGYDDVKAPSSIRLGQGIAGWAALHKQSVICDDAQSDPRYDPEIDAAGGLKPDKLLAVPIMIHGKLLGIIEVLNRADELPFSRDDQVLLELVASMAGAAVENANLFESLRQRLEETSALLEASRSLISLDFRSLIDAIIKRLCEVANTDIAAVYLPDDTGQVLVPFGTHGYETEDARRVSFKMGEGTVGWIALHREALCIDDPAADARFKPLTPEAARFRKILGVPMIDGGRLMGVLQVMNKQDGASFKSADEKFLTAFANHAALAIHNAQLHRETERRLAEVTTLFNVATNVTSFHEMDGMLDSSVSLLNESLGCKRCYVFLRERGGGEFYLKAWAGDDLPGEREQEYIFAKSSHVLESRQPLNVPDAWADLEGKSKPAMRSLVIVPLLVKGDVIGLLCVDSPQKGVFAPDEERLLTIAAAQISMAIDNTYLLESLRERAVELEVANQELEELTLLKSEVMQNVSHELRTPLTFIKGYVELILEDYGSRLPSAVADHLLSVRNKTAVITNLVNDIITLEKLEADSLNMHESSLVDIALDNVEGASAMALQSGIHIQVDFEPGLPPVWADPERIGQVFDNLLGNAIKFMPDGGVIVVWIKRLDDRYLEAGVTDQGIGIPEDKLSRVFERFYQVDGSSKRRYGGTGLGLSIVKKIVEVHGGRVKAESEEGVGSVFSFTIPVLPAYARSEGATADSAPG